MIIKKGLQTEVEIEDVACGGRGLAKLDGMAVFVDQAVPGDRAVIRIFKKKKNYAEARVVDLVEPSAFRVIAPCEYSGYCGGCQWQHIQYTAQLSYKKEQVEEAIEHIGGLKDVKVRDVLPSEEVFAYRNKMEFSFSDNKWLTLEQIKSDVVIADRNALGFHIPGMWDKILDLEKCHLQADPSNAVRDFIIKNDCYK